MPAISKYNPDYHDAWAWSLAIKGATDIEIAQAFGISKRTISRWILEHESFADAVHAGKDAADSLVEKSLYTRALGYSYKDKETLVEMDKDGNAKPIRVKTVEHNVPPDTMAIMYWLNNRKKSTGEWSQSQKVELSGSVGNVDLSKLTDDELVAIANYAASQNGGHEE